MTDDAPKYADPVWEKAPDEPEMDFILFSYYLEMSTRKRSVRGALRRAGMHESNGDAYASSHEWEWEWRAYQYDLFCHKERLAKNRQHQLDAQDAIFKGLGPAVSKLVACLDTDDLDAKANAVRLRAALAILDRAGITKADLLAFDAMDPTVEETEEVWEIEGADDLIDELADWEDGEEE